MRSWLMILSILALGLMPLAAAAETTPVTAFKAEPTSYSAIPARPGKSVDNLLRKIQSYDCKYCRRGCVQDFKIDCYASDRWCRRQFVRCMRECWELICR